MSKRYSFFAEYLHELILLGALTLMVLYYWQTILTRGTILYDDSLYIDWGINMGIKQLILTIATFVLFTFMLVYAHQKYFRHPKLDRLHGVLFITPVFFLLIFWLMLHWVAHIDVFNFYYDGYAVFNPVFDKIGHFAAWFLITLILGLYLSPRRFWIVPIMVIPGFVVWELFEQAFIFFFADSAHKATFLLIEFNDILPDVLIDALGMISSLAVVHVLRQRKMVKVPR